MSTEVSGGRLWSPAIKLATHDVHQDGCRFSCRSDRSSWQWRQWPLPVCKECICSFGA